MATNPELLDVGAVVTRFGPDRHVVTWTNQLGGRIEDVDMVAVRCTRASPDGRCAVGDEDHGPPTRYRKR